MHSVVRALAVAGLAALALSCADDTVGTRGGVRLASLPIQPVFATTPSGGPKIDIETVRGVLRRANSTDSSVASAPVAGDSAILEFEGVRVTGDSTKFNLGVQALDANNVVVFEGTQEVTVTPGNNSPASPALQYAAPDASVASIEILQGATSVSNVALQWLGAIPGNTACLNRVPNPAAITQVQLSIAGRNAANQAVPGVRVGWTSLDPTTATVDDNGLVVARCSNKSTKVIARTFLDKADTVDITVTAPPFTLLMNPEEANVRRGSTLQMQALIVDENNNATATTAVTWHSSDTDRATVDANGVVTALRNGRVVITASSADRTTVGIVDVVRPLAASVVVVPDRDTLAFSTIRRYTARAFDAVGNVIADATSFSWASSNTTIGTVDANGIFTAKTTDGVTNVSASIDGQTDGSEVKVVSSLPPGTLVGRVIDGVTDAPLAGATVGNSGGGSTTTGADGRFTLPGVRGGDDVSISRSGYVTITFTDAPAFPNQTIEVPDVPMPPTGTPGPMTGFVRSAVTGQGVGGMTVRAYAGLNSGPAPERPNATPVATATTASNGSYSISAAAGAYTLVVTGTGYAEGAGVGISVSGGKALPDILLVPATTGGSMFVVVSWAPAGTNVPADLDAHVTGPVSATNPARFQVYSGNRAFLANLDTVAALDLADATGPGPEVISLRQAAAPGTYRFYVKNASNPNGATSRALADSSRARVDVFLDNRLLSTFLPPSGQPGSTWEVFRFDGSRLFPVGTITTPADPTTLAIRAAEPPLGPSKPPIPIRPRR